MLMHTCTPHTIPFLRNLFSAVCSRADAVLGSFGVCSVFRTMHCPRDTDDAETLPGSASFESLEGDGEFLQPCISEAVLKSQ